MYQGSTFLMLTQYLVLPILLVFIGLLCVFGYNANITPLYVLGLSTAASPLPLPFTDFKFNQESFSYRYILYVADNSETYEVEGRSSLIQGPHKEKIAFMSSIMFAPLKIPLFMSVLTYNLCQSDQRHNFLTRPDTTSSIMIGIENTQKELERFIVISCPAS